MHPTIETEDTAEGLIKYRLGVNSVFYATNNYSYYAPIMLETHCEKGIALLEFDRATITYKTGKEIIVINDPTNTLNEADYQAFFNLDSTQMAMQTLKKWGVVRSPITWKTPRPYWGASHIRQIENFYTSLDAGVQPDINAEAALKTQEMICAIYQSAKTNQVVYLAG